MLDLYTYKEQPRQDNEQERIRFFFCHVDFDWKIPKIQKAWQMAMTFKSP